PHPLGRVLDLLLDEYEADVAMLVERGDREHRDQHTDRARQGDLCEPDDTVVGASRNGPPLLDHAALGCSFGHYPSCAKISWSGQPAISSSARAGRKSKQAWARAV